MLNPDLFKSGGGVGYRHRAQVTELAHRLEIVTEKYTESSPTRAFYIAALTSDPSEIEKGLQSEHEMVRFAAMTNVGFVATINLLKEEPLAKYAFAYNQSTSSEVLDAIALTKKKSQNGVIRALVEIHPNKSQEVAALYALSPLGENDEYDDSSYDFFWEAMGYESEKIDLEAMKALTYLDLLNVIEVPGSNDSFWYEAILDNEPSGLKKLYEFAASMPADASNFYYELSVLRCWAAEFLTDKETLEALSEDDFTVSSGIGGFYWADSRSPRSCVIMNEKVSPALVRKIYQEELNNEQLNTYLNGILWRLSVSPQTPTDVIDGLISLIENGVIHDEYTISNMLIGEPSDFDNGLHNNESITQEQRIRVEKLIQEKSLN